ncbi:hypothetical protein PMW75_13635, partial [Eggerthella lenta]|uniref:hypothetical protein n=1 Tax=Eggerthella lenta TaxID=84112 RepID=UPI00232C10B5
MTLVKKSPISITVSRSGFDAFMAMRSRVINAKLGQFRDEIVSVSFLWCLLRRFCYTVPRSTATAFHGRLPRS